MAEERIVSSRTIVVEDRPWVLQEAITGVDADEDLPRRERFDAAPDVERQERATRSKLA